MGPPHLQPRQGCSAGLPEVWPENPEDFEGKTLTELSNTIKWMGSLEGLEIAKAPGSTSI